MSTPTEIVTTFLARWETPGGPDQAIREFFTPETVWENVGLVTTSGQDEAIALNAQFKESFGMEAIWIENLAVAEAGNKVLTERIDHLRDGKGKTIGAFPVMGIFEVAGGKITAWRDYFDSAGALNPAK